MTLAERIAQYRRQKGLSQETLAQQLGISRQSVSKWERGEALPETDKLPALAQALGVSLDTLLTGQQPESEPSFPPARSCRRDPLEMIFRLFRRWGWIGGLILSGYGALLFGMGLLGRVMVRQMFPFPLEEIMEGGSQPFFPIEIITGAAMAAGGLLFLGGLIAAAVLYRKRR